MPTPPSSSSPETRAGTAWLVVGSTLSMAPVAAIVVAAIGFGVGQGVSAVQVPIAVACAFAWSAAAVRALRLPVLRTLCTTWLSVLGVWAAAVALSARVYDLGFDSQSYHQLGIEELLAGWNPMREAAGAHGVYALFVDHYSTGPWVQAALISLLSNDVEVGKAMNVVAIAASFCACLGVLLYTGLASRRVAWLLAVAAAFNPIAIAQATTFYVDGYLASSMTSFCAFVLLSAMEPRPSFLFMSGSLLVLLVNTKFTGVVYPLPVLLAAGLYIYRVTRVTGTGRPRALARFVVVHALCLLIGVAFVGLHPYVTNFLAHGHPFYPLRGAAAAHSIVGLRPLGLRDAGSVLGRLVLSLFADPSTEWATSRDIYKWPFALSDQQLVIYGTPDPRVGGWGPWFGGVLLASVAAFFAVLIRARGVRRALPLVAGTLVASVLVNSECWWARFSPQLALLPVAVAAACLFRSSSGSRPAPGWGGAVLALTLANAALVLYAQAESVPRRSAELSSFLDELARTHPTLYVSDRWVAPLRRLTERGIPFVPVRDDGDEPDAALPERVPCRPWHEFPGTMQEIRYCTARDVLATAH